ncbi:hypothetical protein TG4357_03510 [Thalassovita gelatinovora]|uniref:Uncharacterized protein n=1 Tax=Thalassovita gelatinovora TaxID=53501 RepID=A0A0P1G314_THAGE|nr:hypothetical protein [Thalassovita gelatinovora]QIZ82308.1 hypothetical protein HFZ77_18405 [Thalassovita gelatinovora]CUH68317.1 hypothetical protein TG4357_03510 [Thalassovita gelatinovora]
MKKMLVDYIPEFGMRPGKAWVVPIGDTAGDGFVCLSNKKTARYGAVIYVGRVVTSADLREKIQELGLGLSSDEVLADFLSKVNSLKIGDVVSLDRGGDGMTILTKEKMKAMKPSKKKLP